MIGALKRWRLSRRNRAEADRDLALIIEARQVSRQAALNALLAVSRRRSGR